MSCLLNALINTACRHEAGRPPRGVACRDLPRPRVFPHRFFVLMCVLLLTLPPTLPLDPPTPQCLSTPHDGRSKAKPSSETYVTFSLPHEQREFSLIVVAHEHHASRLLPGLQLQVQRARWIDAALSSVFAPSSLRAVRSWFLGSKGSRPGACALTFMLLCSC